MKNFVGSLQYTRFSLLETGLCYNTDQRNSVVALVVSHVIRLPKGPPPLALTGHCVANLLIIPNRLFVLVAWILESVCCEPIREVSPNLQTTGLAGWPTTAIMGYCIKPIYIYIYMCICIYIYVCF